MKRGLFFQFFGVHTAILCGAIGLIAVAMWDFNTRTNRKLWISEMEFQAHLAAALLTEPDGTMQPDVEETMRRMAADPALHRVTVILPDGQVMGETRRSAAEMALHHDRPEVVQAMKKGRGLAERYSATLRKPMMYFAWRIPQEGPLQAVVRIAVPRQQFEAGMTAHLWLFWGGAFVVLLVAFAVSYYASLRIIGPVNTLEQDLARVGEGELSHRASVPPVPHLSDVARAINHTVEQLERQIKNVEEEKNLRMLILRNMIHGVIALDMRHAVMVMNTAARNILHVGDAPVEGRMLYEVARSAEISALIERSRECADTVEAEMTAHGKALELRAMPLNDVAERRIGTLIVLTDVTVVRRLERVRQDFVANVSHELKTPVTSICGFSESLLEGALAEPETAKRFVEIIHRQSCQLESILKDLIDLVRLEQGTGKALEKVRVPLLPLLGEVVNLCRERAAERHVAINVTCDEDLTAEVHEGLLEQALVNLVDNAVKYGATAGQDKESVSGIDICGQMSTPDTNTTKIVDIIATAEGTGVKITVRDYGAGIDRQHQERIFERFYRIDKGRSRDMGGTGLGLAIVKHIALVHRGTVSVHSEPGKGSAFTLQL